MDTTQAEVVTAVMTAFGTTVATDAWNGFKSALSHILSRADNNKAEQEEVRLDRDRDKILLAHRTDDNDRKTRIGAIFSERIVEFLEDYPDAIEELRQLAASYNGTGDLKTTSQVVNNHNIATGNSTIAAPGFGNVTLHVSDQ